jgi:hypothetical protein
MMTYGMMIKNASPLVLSAILVVTLICTVLWADANASGSKSSISIADETRTIADGSKPDETQGVSIRVLWSVTGYVLGKDSSWTDLEAKGFIFKPLDVRENEITFDGRTCKEVNFERETVDAAEFLLEAWHTTPQALNISDQQLQVIRTTCDIPGFQEYVRLSNGFLIVPLNGGFFFFEPVLTR